MNSRRMLISTFLFISLTLCAFAPAFMTRIGNVQAIQYPKVYIAPSIAYAEPDQTVNISIMIANIMNFWGYQIYLSYSPDILEIPRNTSTSDPNSVNAYYVYQGDFLRRGTYSVFWQPKVNNTLGLLQAWESLLKPAPESEGNGELFRIVFKVKKAGSSILNMTSAELVNMFAVPIPHDVENGAVTSTKLGITPDLIKGEEHPPDTSFDVNVSLDGAIENFYGFDLNVTYNTQVLNVSSVTLLPLLEMPNINATDTDYDQGRIRLFMNCSTPASPINTTGAVATITFKVLPSEQKTDIEIANSTLFDVFGNQMIYLVVKAMFTGGLIRNIGIAGATLSLNAVTAGTNINLTIAAYNNGTRNETFTVLVHAIDNITALVGGPTEFTILSNQSATLTMTLETFGLDGNYTVYVQMSSVPDESIISDNNYVISSVLSVTPQTEPPPSPFGTLFYVIVAIVVIVIAVFLIYYLRRRR